MNKRILLNLNPLLLFFGTLFSAQEGDANPVQYVSAETLQEEIVLFTDRSLYSSNEQIYFSAKYITSEKLPPGIQWSTVLYIELIKPDGTALVQNKYPFSSSGASGYIHIPNEIHSGVYYLKAYTKWMRNYPTSSYGYCQIKLINPNNLKISEVSEEKPENKFLYKTVQENKDIVLTTNKNSYGTRENVNITFVDNQKHDTPVNYVISVVPKGSKFNTVLASPTGNIRAEQDMSIFYPETNGISLSGRVFNTSGRAIENAQVSLSLLNEQSYFFCVKTNSKGEFVFYLPASAYKHDFFIDAEKDSLSLNIELDKEFCDKPVFLNAAPFKLTAEEKILAKEIGINSQLSEVFKDTNTIAANHSDSKVEQSFYGTPDMIYYTKDYIDLPYLEEFVFEIIPRIKFSNKEPVAIESYYKNSLHLFPLLILVDNIPVTNLNAVAKIRTNTVERFELIFDGYILGSNKYGGVMNIFTKNKDLSGIDLPESSMFFSYSMYTNQEETEKFTSFPLNGSNSRTSDRRNCLYWNPDYQPVKNSENHFNFYTSDNRGKYQVIVEAVAEDGSWLITAGIEFVVE